MNIRNTLFIACCRAYYRSACQSPTSHSRRGSPNQRACHTRPISSHCCMKRSNASASWPSGSDLDSRAGAEMTIEDGALVLRRPASPARTGWAEAARRIAEAGDDELVMGEFGNAEDSELVW